MERMIKMQSEQIITVIDELAEKFGIAVDWASDNVISYIQEIASKYIAWKITSSYIWLGIGVICIIAAVVFLLMGNRQRKKSNNYSQLCRQAERENADEEDIDALKDKRYDADQFMFGFYFIAALLGIVGFLIIIPTIFTLVKYYMTPEIQFFEYIRSMTLRW